MPILSPTSGDVHVNKMLTNVLIGYTNEQYIADEIFPLCPVDKQTDIIPSINQDFFFRNDAGVIAEGTAAPESGYQVTKTDTYYCLPVGWRHFISDQRRMNEDSPFNSDREASMLANEKIMLNREIAFMSDFWATSVWSTDITGGTTTTKWSDFGGSDPITDIRTYKRTVRRLIGRDPNVLVMGDLSFDVLCDHPDFLARVQYGGTPANPATVSTAAMAAVFGVSKVVVGKSIYTSVQEGGTVTYSSIWDDDALLLYVPDAPSIWTPAGGYTFTWKAGAEAPNALTWVRKYRDDVLLGDFIEARSCYDQKKCVAAAGAFFSDIVDAPSNV